MLRFIGWLLTPLLGILTVAIAQSLWQTGWSHPAGEVAIAPSIWVWFACPAAFFIRAAWAITCSRFGWDNPWSFIDTLEHELTHALFGYLTLNPPVSLKASLQGEGEVQLKGQNVLTLLSPYFFPLFLTISALLSLGMAKEYRLGFTVLCLGLMGSFFFRLMAEFRWRQSDLHAYGFFFSSAFSAAALLGVLGMNLSILGLLSWNWIHLIPEHVLQGVFFLSQQGRSWFSQMLQ
jgi:hypothetical protein